MEKYEEELSELIEKYGIKMSKFKVNKMSQNYNDYEYLILGIPEHEFVLLKVVEKKVEKFFRSRAARDPHVSAVKDEHTGQILIRILTGWDTAPSAKNESKSNKIMKLLEDKVVSCGVIVTDGKSILLGHSTGNSWWDVPKGQIDQREEAPIECAKRELEEETGLVVDKSELKPMGRIKYLPHKDLELFMYKMDPMPPEKTFKCKSTFTLHGREVPELDKFKIVPWEEKAQYVTVNMNNALDKVKLN